MCRCRVSQHEFEELRQAIVTELEFLAWGPECRRTFPDRFCPPQAPPQGQARDLVFEHSLKTAQQLVYEHSTRLAVLIRAGRRHAAEPVAVEHDGGRPGKFEYPADPRMAIEKWSAVLRASASGELDQRRAAIMGMPRLPESVHVNVQRTLRAAGIGGLPSIAPVNYERAADALDGYLTRWKTRPPAALNDDLRLGLMLAYFDLTGREPGFSVTGIEADDGRLAYPRTAERHGERHGPFHRFVQDIENACSIKILGNSWSDWQRVWHGRKKT